MGANKPATRASVMLADFTRSVVGHAAYLLGLPVAHVLSTVAEWGGRRDAYEIHAAVLRAEERLIAWAHRREADGRVVGPELRRCS